MLDQPLTLPNGQTLPNRLAKAAMTEGLADMRDRPTARHLRLYERWAAGGVGLIITGNVMVDRRFLERPGNVVVEGDGNMAALQPWAETAKAGGGRLWMQISHPGRQCTRFVAAEPVAPSAVPAVKMLGAFGKPRALTPGEIADLIRRFANVAAIAEAAGFDGCQIHAAHGYLISQFLSPLTNRRSDDWGGTPEKRRRMLKEVVQAIRKRVRPDFAVSVKLNSADFQRGGFTGEESADTVRMLSALDVDLIEISGGNYEQAAMFDQAGRESTRQREAYFLEYAETVRDMSRVPLMVTGGFRTRAAMESALRDGATDVIGLARPLALEPDLPRRLIAGEADGSLATDKRIGIHAMDALAGVGWYWEQMVRMADGKDPDPNLPTLYPALHYLVGDMVKAIRRKRSHARSA